MSGAASESCFPFTLQPDFSERFVNGKQPRASRSAHCLGMLMANNRCRSLRGRRKKGRGRGREKSTPSLFLFFPILYPFRRPLRRLPLSKCRVADAVSQDSDLCSRGFVLKCSIRRVILNIGDLKIEVWPVYCKRKAAVCRYNGFTLPVW